MTTAALTLSVLAAGETGIVTLVSNDLVELILGGMTLAGIVVPLLFRTREARRQMKAGPVSAAVAVPTMDSYVALAAQVEELRTRLIATGGELVQAKAEASYLSRRVHELEHPDAPPLPPPAEASPSYDAPPPIDPVPVEERQ